MCSDPESERTVPEKVHSCDGQRNLVKPTRERCWIDGEKRVREPGGEIEITHTSWMTSIFRQRNSVGSFARNFYKSILLRRIEEPRFFHLSHSPFDLDKKEKDLHILKGNEKQLSILLRNLRRDGTISSATRPSDGAHPGDASGRYQETCSRAETPERESVPIIASHTWRAGGYIQSMSAFCTKAGSCSPRILDDM